MGKHNPVLNGTTKITVISATMFLGILTLAAMLCLVIPISLGGLPFYDLLAMKSIFGGIATAGMTIFRRLIYKFMDTRTYHEKHLNDIEKLRVQQEIKQSKLDYKLAKRKIKKG